MSQPLFYAEELFMRIYLWEVVCDDELGFILIVYSRRMAAIKPQSLQCYLR